MGVLLHMHPAHLNNTINELKQHPKVPILCNVY